MSSIDPPRLLFTIILVSILVVCNLKPAWHLYFPPWDICKAVNFSDLMYLKLPFDISSIMMKLLSVMLTGFKISIVGSSHAFAHCGRVKLQFREKDLPAVGLSSCMIATLKGLTGGEKTCVILSGIDYIACIVTTYPPDMPCAQTCKI